MLCKDFLNVGSNLDQVLLRVFEHYLLEQVQICWGHIELLEEHRDGNIQGKTGVGNAVVDLHVGIDEAVIKLAKAGIDFVQFDSLGSKLVLEWLTGPPELPEHQEEVWGVEEHPVGEGAGRGGDPVLLPPAGVQAAEARSQLLPLANRGGQAE